MSIWGWPFWRATIERVLRVALWAFGGLIAANGFDFRHADWGYIANVVAVAAGLALVACFGANAVTGTGPSFNQTEVVSPPAVVPADPRRAAGDLGHPDNLYPPPVTRRDDV